MIWIKYIKATAATKKVSVFIHNVKEKVNIEFK